MKVKRREEGGVEVGGMVVSVLCYAALGRDVDWRGHWLELLLSGKW